MKMIFARAISITVLWGLFAPQVFAAPDLANGKNTRTDSKVKSVANLKKMVGLCNTELRLDLFPEDEADVVAYLNQQFYKFKP